MYVISYRGNIQVKTDVIELPVQKINIILIYIRTL